MLLVPSTTPRQTASALVNDHVQTVVTCWQRLWDWQTAGVWDRLHRELLERLYQADRLDWSRACLDSSSIAAKGG